MMSCSTSKSWYPEKAERTSQRRRGLSTSATATRRMCWMPTLAPLALFLLLSSGCWPQMVSSAPTPQHNDAITTAVEHKDDGSLLDIEGGRDDGKKSTRLEPPDIRGRDQRQTSSGSQPSPEIHLIDNVNFMFSSFQDDSLSTTSLSERTMTPRSVDHEDQDQPNLVFNMVIQKERTEKSAFIAPDVNWLRDLVPKVVDVVEQPETTIKEIIFNAMEEENAIQAEPMRDRKLFINVVKSQIGSENDVPEILASLRNLMQTGGPAVESKLLESRDIGEPQTRIYVINIIIFNVVVLTAPVEQPVFVNDKVAISNLEADITEDSYIVALRESQKNRVKVSSSFGRNKSPAAENQQLARTPDTGVEEDSYIVALKESQKNRNKGSSPAIDHHHHHHEEKHHHHEAKPHHHQTIDEDATSQQQQFNGHFLTEVPTYGYVSTARPLMAMEKDYLRRYAVKPVQQQESVDEEEQQLADEQEQSSDGQEQLANEQQQLSPIQSPIVDPFGSLEYVNLPTGPYFTNFGSPAVQIVNSETTTSSIEKPPVIESVVFDVAETGGVVNSHKVQTTKKPVVVVKKPLIVRVPEAVGVMTNKATNVVRNRIRTVGLFGIPMMVGLATTVNSWLPAVTAFGRRRRRRSTITDEEENWEDSNNNHEMSGDDDRSRTIGNAQMLARLMGKRAESLLDNWRHREQETTTSNVEFPTQSTTDTNKSKAKKKRPLWFQRLSNVKRPNGSRTSRKMKDIISSSRKYMTPLFYATFFGNEKEDVDNQNAAGDVMEHREDILKDSEAVAEYDLEQPEVLLENDAETIEPPMDTADDPSADYGDDKPEEKEIEMEETQPEEDIPVSPLINSHSGSDFDIVSNFVRAMMMNNNDNENKDGEDSIENREEIFWVKEASIVNTTETVSSKPIKPPVGSSLLLLKPGVRVPSIGINGNTVSLFSADPVKQTNWINNNNENVTNSPITYVSIKSPTKVTWLGVGPPDAITSTQSSSAESFDDPAVETEINNSDLPPSEIVGAPLEFYNEETDNYVSKEVPSVPVQATIPYYSDQPPSTNEPPPQPLADPGDMSKPLRPMVFRPNDLRPGLSSLLLTIASFNRPRLPPPIDVSSSVATQGEGNITPSVDEFRDDTTVKYTHGHGIVTPNDETLKYTHGHGIIVTNPPLYDMNQLEAESSLEPESSSQNQSPNLIKSTTDGQYDDESPSPSLMGDTSYQFVGMYGGTTVNSTYGEFSTTGFSDSSEMESTLDDLITQLQTNLTTGWVTDRPVGGLHFVNSSTEIVIMNPFVTASSIFPQLQVEAVEAEEGDTFGAIENVEQSDDNSIVVDAAEGNQPDSVPVVSNLANLFFGSSGSSSSSGSLSTNGGLSAGGISGGSVSSSTTNPLALLYTFGLAAIGILALTLPLWVPFVVAKKRRRTYAPSKTYPASKKKTPASAPPKKTYGEPPPNHYKDLSEEEIYGSDPYFDQQQLATGPTQPTQYTTTTVEDLFRPSVELRNSDYTNDHYIFRDSIALNPQDDMFNNPGPLNSEDVYGPPARIFLKARRRRSSRFQPSNKR